MEDEHRRGLLETQPLDLSLSSDPNRPDAEWPTKDVLYVTVTASESQGLRLRVSTGHGRQRALAQIVELGVPGSRRVIATKEGTACRQCPPTS